MQAQCTRRTTVTTLLRVSVVLLPCLPRAEPQTQPEPPAALQALLPQARLSGTARFTHWGFDVYNASLWVTPGFQGDAFWQRPFALELAYLRSLQGTAIAKRSIEEMQRAGWVPPAQARQWEDAMRALFPDVKAGDRITGIHQPGVGARFLVNDQPVGDIAGADFSQRFFGIWLATTTSAPQLRRSLLGASPP
jgi:hypothetical protein